MHRHLAVLGSPIAHSRSPRIHAAAYRVLDLPWEYEAIELREPELKSFLDSRDPSWLGCSVTMPLKEEAHRLSQVRDPLAEESGVVNTLLRLIDHNGLPAWAGFNTDVAGLAAALTDHAFDMQHTMVLGAGATAVSAVMAARMLGAQTVQVVARREEAAATLANKFSSKLDEFECSSATFTSVHSESASSTTCVISTIPGTAQAQLDAASLPTHASLFDVAYDPWPSPFAEYWTKQGSVAASGLDMLVHQALIQVRIFLNGDPGVALPDEAAVRDAMRQAVVEM